MVGPINPPRQGIYRLIKELSALHENWIASRIAHEALIDAGDWLRAYVNENRECSEGGPMRHWTARVNGLSLSQDLRLYPWPGCPALPITQPCQAASLRPRSTLPLGGQTSLKGLRLSSECSSFGNGNRFSSRRLSVCSSAHFDSSASSPASRAK